MELFIRCIPGVWTILTPWEQTDIQNFANMLAPVSMRNANLPWVYVGRNHKKSKNALYKIVGRILRWSAITRA